MVRAKFRLTSVKESKWNPAPEVKASVELRFDAVYDDGIEENQRFSKATPSGCLTMQVDNPAALEQMKLGQAYYLDMTPAEG